jgi:hypothetical protein
MAKNDIFKYELPFEITKKGNRGTSIGYILTQVYRILIWAYVISQAMLFFNHKADSYESNIIQLDVDDMTPVKFKEMQIGIGLGITSLDPTVSKVITDPEELAKYVSITSLMATTEAGSNDPKYTLTKPLISCEGILDYKKFKNLKKD